MEPAPIRNICIIAHVDHGKTTLVDHILRQAGTFASHSVVEDRVMDSMDLERERGITIQAKNAAYRYQDVKVNIVDTPGHADFGGEVERIMGMVDGSILLVDAAEGPLPQTRFVLERSLRMGHRIIVCINKVDRPEVQELESISKTVDKVFDLFIDLGASETQADFPIVYACARQGWCTTDLDKIPALREKTATSDLKPLLNLINDVIPPPKVEGGSQPFRMLISNLAYSDYVGQLSIGRIASGSVQKNQTLYRKGIKANGEALVEKFQVTKILVFEGLRQSEANVLEAGDIGLVSGCEGVEIGDTLVDSADTQPLPRIIVESPTLRMMFSINSSPLSGQEGEAIQSRKLRERLQRECRNNVALRFEDSGDMPDQLFLLGRGELQFAILIEQMRREGFEFTVGRPIVLYRTSDDGEKLEPMERAVLDLPEVYSGDITRMLQERKGVLSRYEQSGHGESGQRVRLEFEIPTRGLLGIRSRYLTSTRGEGLFSAELLGFGPYKGEIVHRINGSIIADRAGEAVEYSLSTLEERGVLFVEPGTKVYEGMIIGEHSRENDLNVNPCKEKKLTNVRAAGSDGLTILAGIRRMPLEAAMEWIDEDECIEVTPVNIRIRKRHLAEKDRSVIRRK